MPLLLLVFTLLFHHQHIAATSSATTDTISAGQPLGSSDKLVSGNGRYALGFFETGSESNWYMGIWFNTVPKLTPAWVANRDNPVKNTILLQLAVFHDGNLVILDKSKNSIIWSTGANITTNDTIAVLLDSGNLILHNPSNPSDIMWQSFDYPTDTFFPGAKLGWDKATGLNRRLVSWKNSVNPATGTYSEELDPSGVDQYLLTALNSPMPYWSSGAWNGQYFALMPETSNRLLVNFTFINNDQEKYFMYTLDDETMVIRNYLDMSGQAKAYMWLESSQKWVPMFAQPKACDVYAICGPFTSFTVRSPKDWELDDRTSGCTANAPLECSSNRSTSSADRFYSMPCVGLPQNAQRMQVASSATECAQVCQSDCSCTAYSFGNSGCSIWHNDLLNVRQQECNGISSTDGEILYLRLSTKETLTHKANRRGLIVGTSFVVAALGLLALVVLLVFWKNKTMFSGGILNNAQGFDGITVFGYTDLQRATKHFSEKLGGGSFGSVFKGSLSDSTTIAVKRLDHAYQGEKQFRAERRTTIPWNSRYQIALGVARGLAYLHESCQDCIIHCDIKPENILLDASFAPKIADFGMAKLLGRDFSRVLTTARGTAGYLAPEWICGVAITPKADVYSYGMVLLEIISGRRNSRPSCACDGYHDDYFPVYVARKLLQGDTGSLVDHRVYGDVNLDEAQIACKVACWCIQDNEFDRPTMGQVVHILEGLTEISVPPMPRLLQAITGTGSSHSTCSQSLSVHYSNS
ncbi:G-type lectin S-receptor-like serine/threonine-protein kinase At2g19130 [Lolium rigidum]|uniref:G-type lectin S-receptor-like serine/threonine-protein kinase At2g19130 n=1 Tax=Lolium rigidum TaxID=89674 RepID=UPI001F5D9C9D|nr:G-type lectin S-receptor-like serine/threonine-protein kinase At2g19130 [Lolium rigidum]XP_051211632.1 G-type lectin S-receptor-like serine/threonine-protein kinase At2g19130 [Lolium perenne]